MLLTDLLERHYVVHREVSAGYEASIRSAIRTFQAFLAAQAQEPVRPAKLKDLSDESLNACAAYMIRKKLSRASANRVLRTLSALATFAFRRKLGTYRPDVEKVSERLPRPICWRPEEFSRLVAAINKSFGDGQWGRMLFAIVMVTYDTGLRVIDSLAIESTIESFRSGVIFVVEKKTGAPRAFKLHTDTLKAIRSAFGNYAGGKCIRYPYKETNPLRVRLRKALDAAGLSTDRRSLFQKIRRTTATEARRAGLNPTEVLNHSAAWVTRAYYEDRAILPPMDVANKILRPVIPQNEQHSNANWFS